MSDRAETAENVKPSIKLTIQEDTIIKGYHGCSVAVGVDEKFIVEIGIQLIRWRRPPFNTLQHEPMAVRWPLTFKFEV